MARMEEFNDRNIHEDLFDSPNLPSAENITIEKLHEIYDHYLHQRSSSLSSSTRANHYLVDILQLIEKVNKTILQELLLNHNQFHFHLTDKIYHLIKKFYKINFLNDIELTLFHYIIQYFIRIDYHPDKLLRPIIKTLHFYSKDPQYFSNENYLKDVSNLISLYLQDEDIIDSVTKCLTSKYYIQSFQQTSNYSFLLIACPAYWIEYTGPHREDFADKLLNTLLIPASVVLKGNFWNNSPKGFIYLIDLLNSCFQQCHLNLLIDEHFILITDSLLSILVNPNLFEQQRAIIRSSIRFLLTLIEKSEHVSQHVKQRQQIFRQLIDRENHVYLILSSLMNDEQIIKSIHNNHKFAETIQDFLQQKNEQIFYQQPILTKRLKLLFERSKIKEAGSHSTRQDLPDIPILSLPINQEKFKNADKDPPKTLVELFNVQQKDTKNTSGKPRKVPVDSSTIQEESTKSVSTITSETLTMTRKEGKRTVKDAAKVSSEPLVQNGQDPFKTTIQIDARSKDTSKSIQHDPPQHTTQSTMMDKGVSKATLKIPSDSLVNKKEEIDRSEKNLGQVSVQTSITNGEQSKRIRKNPIESSGSHGERTKIIGNGVAGVSPSTTIANGEQTKKVTKPAVEPQISNGDQVKRTGKDLPRNSTESFLVNGHYPPNSTESYSVKEDVSSIAGTDLSRSEINPFVANGQKWKNHGKGSLEPLLFSNENANREEITLIWYEKHLSNAEELDRKLISFQEINDYVIICSSRSKLLKCIDQIKKEVIFLILSIENPEEIIQLLHDHQQIYLIFIFPVHAEKSYNLNKFPKIVGIYSDMKTLLLSIKEHMIYYMKQSEAITLFQEEDEDDLNEPKSILIFKHGLLTDRFNHPKEKDDLIHMCRNYYRKNFKELSQIERFEKNYRVEDAMNWFRKETFLSRLIHKALRYEDYQTLLISRFLLHDISKSILVQSEHFKSQQPSSQLILYRGMKLPKDLIEHFQKNLDKTLTTNTFLSTVKSKVNALKWTRKGIKYSNEERVLLEIEVDLSKPECLLMNINPSTDDSNVDDSDQEEILFDFGTSFHLNSIDYNHQEKIWVIKLVFVSNQSFEKVIQTYFKENVTKTNPEIFLGQLFFLMEKSQKSQKYFQNLLTLTKSDDLKSLSEIYDVLGQICEYDNNYDLAIENYKKASDYYYSLKQYEDVARITNYIGIIYFNKNDKINAKTYFHKSHQLWTSFQIHKSTDQNLEYARLMSCLGCLEDNHQLAEEYFLKALQIYENPSNSSNQDYYIAQVSEYLAERYFYQNDYTNALKYLIKTIHIRLKYLSTIQEQVHSIKSLMKLWTFSQKIDPNLWTRYEEQFFQLIKRDTIQLIPQLEAFLDDAIFFQRNYLDHNQSNQHLQDLIRSLGQTLQIDKQNYQRIIQLHFAIGIAYAKIDQFNWASEHLRKALQICKIFTPLNNELVVNIFQSLSNIETKKNDLSTRVILSKGENTIEEKHTEINEKEKEAQTYFQSGEKLMNDDYDKALEYFLKSLEIHEKNSKVNDLIVGICHQNIGATYVNKHLYDKALEHYNRAVYIYEEHLNEKEENEKKVQILYGKCHCEIARIYQKENYYDKSTEYFLKTIQIMENNFPSSNLCFLSDCYEGIGLNFYRKSQYDISIDFYHRCLNFLLTHIKTSPSCDHQKEITSCLIDLSCVYIDKKEYQLALENLEKISQLLPENHKDLGNSFLFIGLCFMEQKQYTIAVKNFNTAITHYEKHLPVHRENYALCYSHLGTCYSNMSKDLYDKGVQCILKAIDIYESHYPEQNSNIAQCYWTYAYILSKKGKYDEAIPNLYKSLELRLNEDSINIGLAYNLLGLCYCKKFEFQQALSSLLKSMTNYETHLLDLYNEIGASVFLDIATCLLRLNNYDFALQYALKSLEIREELFPMIDLQRAESHSILALIYAQEQVHEDDKCNEHLAKTVQICRQLIHDHDDLENIGEIFQNVAEVFLSVNDIAQSKKYYQIAATYMKIDKIENHVDVQRVENIIEELEKTELLFRQ